jgi:hypothetical protein
MYARDRRYIVDKMIYYGIYGKGEIARNPLIDGMRGGTETGYKLGVRSDQSPPMKVGEEVFAWNGM